MNGIGNTQLAIIPIQTISVSSAGAQASSASDTVLPDGISNQINFDTQAAEQARYEAVQQAAQKVANIYVISDQKFTIFKDATGQYITRFTSLRDGKVTYVPEPVLLKMGNAGASPQLTITA